MSLGIFSAPIRPVRRRPPMQGLGATIPANCWDTPGFKTCNAQGWALAESKCRSAGQPTALAIQSYGGNVDACKQDQADDYAYFGCTLRLCPPPAVKHPTSSGGWTWMNTSPNASVKAFQQHLNTALAADGYKTINADGKLGPATCGAFNFVGGAHPELFANDPIANIGVCQSFTNPTKVGSSKPEPSPTSEEAKKLDAQYGGLPWMQPDTRVASLQHQLNVQLDSNGFLPIAVTGMLDPPTCGAMLWLDQNTGTVWFSSWGPRGGGACPAVVMPKPKKTASKPKPPGPITPKPEPTPEPGPATPTASSSALMGGLILAAVVGGALWLKHKAGA